MENNNTLKRIHPLVAGAAIAVMLVSLTGVAAITGLLPNSHGTAATGASAAPMPPTAEALTPTAPTRSAQADQQNDAPRPPQASGHAQPRQMAAQGPAVCHSCGRVEAVQAIEHAAQPSGVGVVAGALLGGVLGNQVGSGNGRKLATVAGAVGGGYAGNEVEKRSRGTTSFQVRVRMEDGAVRTFPYAQQPDWNAGDRVRVVDGQLTSRA